MKITKTKLAAATFGAAMTSLYSAPELNAQVNIEFDVNTIDFFTLPGSQNLATPVQFLNVTSGSYAIPGVDNAAIALFNDNPYGVGAFANFFTGFDGGIEGLAVVNAGDFFTGATTGYNVTFDQNETGIRYIGFLAGGGVGWFSLDLGTSPTDELLIVAGAFNQGVALPGITVGESVAVPEPASVGLGLLGMGLVGLRRRRKAAAATAV